MPKSNSSVQTFDLEAHRRERLRTAESRASMLERERARVERLLALALRVAAGNECEPLVLLRALEGIDRLTSSGEEEEAE